MAANSPRPDDIDFWRAKVDAARQKYSQDRTEETREELRRVLRILMDLVDKGRLPPPT